MRREELLNRYGYFEWKIKGNKPRGHKPFSFVVELTSKIKWDRLKEINPFTTPDKEEIKNMLTRFKIKSDYFNELKECYLLNEDYCRRCKKSTSLIIGGVVGQAIYLHCFEYKCEEAVLWKLPQALKNGPVILKGYFNSKSEEEAMSVLNRLDYLFRLLLDWWATSLKRAWDNAPIPRITLRGPSSSSIYKKSWQGNEKNDVVVFV